MTKPTPLAAQLRDIRRNLGLTQNTLAPLIGTAQSNLSSYERGRCAPSIPGADAWARALNHHLIVTHHNATLCHLADLWRDLPDYRKSIGVSRAQVAHAMRATQSTIREIDMRIRAGTAVRLTTLIPYIHGLPGHHIQLVPAHAEGRAA